MAGLETQYGHWRTVDSHGNVNEGDGWICNNTTTSGHMYVGNDNGDSDNIQEFQSSYGKYYSAHIKKLSVNESYREANAWVIFKYLKAAGWSTNAIAGLCGNIQNESGFNPGVYEGYKKRAWPSVNFGVGLTQWTPNVKYFDWAKENGDLHVYAIDSQLARINYESLNNIQYGRASSWPYKEDCEPNFTSFRVSEASPFQLGKNFWYCYERPASTAEENGNARGRNAEKWYTFFTGSQPPGPGPEPDPNPTPTPGSGTNLIYQRLEAIFGHCRGLVNRPIETIFRLHCQIDRIYQYGSDTEKQYRVLDDLGVDSYTIKSGKLPKGCYLATEAVLCVMYKNVTYTPSESPLVESGRWSYDRYEYYGKDIVVKGTPEEVGEFTIVLSIVAQGFNVDGLMYVDVIAPAKGWQKILLRKDDEDDLQSSIHPRIFSAD